MTRPYVNIIASGVLACGFALSTMQVALPAGKPSAASHAGKAVRAVAVFNQAQLIAQGLSPQAALHEAARRVPYPMTTTHYIPRGFQLTLVRIYPFIPNVQVPQDTQTFQNMAAVNTVRGRKRGTVQAPTFEIDHQAAQPYVYPKEAFYTISTIRLAGHPVSVAEQKYTDVRKHKAIDLLFVYWYDTNRKVATEVTAELLSARLSRAEVFKIAASVR